jgi:predicted 3-demethylubiquinone-9 3-methyltransferase (glyoxalase superfamily)
MILCQGNKQQDNNLIAQKQSFILKNTIMETANNKTLAHKIVPFLWYENNAEDAMNFYTSCFKNSKITSRSYYNEESAKASGQAKDSLMTGSFMLNNQEFIVINGGSVFHFNPSISLFVNCETEQETDELWNKLSGAGKVLMEFKPYPFSKKYGWLQDKFGLSWQLNFTETPQKIAPCLMFSGKREGKAEEAINYYMSLFKNSEVKVLARYEAGEQGVEGNIKHSRFTLSGEDFVAMDAHIENNFSFTPAVSFMVFCKTQDEIDYFWNNLTSGGKEIECGWLEDKFGISWQIVPENLNKLLSNPDPAKAKRAMHAMLQMKKLVIADLEA